MRHRLRRRYLTVGLAAAVCAGGAGIWLAVGASPASAGTTFTAKVALDGRDGASLEANVVKADMYPAGGPVSVTCQDRGGMAYGSTIWDRTAENVWVPDTYMKTGYDGFVPGVARCDDLAQDGRSFPATADLNGRAGPALTARLVEENMYRTGDIVTVVCQLTGGAAYGSTIWDKTDDGVFVPDAYVETGSTGFTAGLARCADGVTSRFGYAASVDLAGRASKSVTAAEVKTYPAGSTVYITCQDIGANAYGSTIWDKTVDSVWVADHYLKTGYDTFVPGVPRCTATSTSTPSGTGTGFPAKIDLAGRASKSVTAAEVKTYPAGSTVRITCQAYGTWAYGSYIWDKTVDRLWVADYYLKTGVDGFLSDMPRCDDDQPSGGGGGSAGDCGVGHGRIDGPAGSTSGTTAERVARVVADARSMTGKGLSYSWGGGGKGGPSCGISSPSPGGFLDYNRFGFDCSGYTLYAYWHGAGVNIGPNTGTQHGVGRRLPYSERKPGDLIFWFEGGVTVHVAIYVGDDRMLEAAPPRGTGSVHETAVYGTHSQVVRVIG